MPRDYDQMGDPLGDEIGETRPRTWLWVLLLAVIAFVGGLVATGYVVSHDQRLAKMIGLEPLGETAALQQTARRIVVSPQPASSTAATSAIDPTLATRVDTLEDKVSDIEAQAREATGDASRAEGLLVAFAARRALDRGTELGYIEGLLRQRFGGSQPQAVAAILSAARQPVTLADLENGLDTIAPTLSVGGNPKQSWWQSFRQELAGMVVVRKAGEPSSQPADRVARAQRMLEAGQVDGALAEIMRLTDHAAADKWIVAARRYLSGRGALDQIETAALLDPTTSIGAPAGSTGWPLAAPGSVPATTASTPAKAAVSPPVD